MASSHPLALAVASLAASEAHVRGEVEAVHRYLDEMDVPRTWFSNNEEQALSLLERIQTMVERFKRPIPNAVVQTERLFEEMARLGPAMVQIILDVTAQRFRMTKKALLSRERSRNVAHARQIAMYLCRKHVHLPFSEIGREIGGRDHSTIQYAVRTVEQRMREDENTHRIVVEIERDLGLAQILNLEHEDLEP